MKKNRDNKLKFAMVWFLILFLVLNGATYLILLSMENKEIENRRSEIENNESTLLNFEKDIFGHEFDQIISDLKYIKDSYKREALNKLLHSLMDKGYSVIDKGYKRFPRGVNSETMNSHLYLYKGMATYKVLDPKLIEDGDKLIDTLYKIYEDMLPLQQIVYEISLRVKEEK